MIRVPKSTNMDGEKSRWRRNEDPLCLESWRYTWFKHSGGLALDSARCVVGVWKIGTNKGSEVKW